MDESLPKTGASAVAAVLRQERTREEEATASSHKKGRRGRPSSAISDDQIAQLVSAAQEQQQLLLSRLVSNDPTRRVRHPAKPVSTSSQIATVVSTPTRRNHHAPITIAEFDRKYAAKDPMLHYMLHVVKTSKRVVRVDIPRTHGRAVRKPSAVPEEDVLFLIYHPNPPCGFRNIYWLSFVSEERAVNEETEYFTLSLHGLTHIRGAAVVEFADVDGWISEKRAFDYMTNMTGLQKLQALLFFLSWKNKAIRLKHMRIRHRIACSLFYCDYVAARMLVQLRAHCMTIEELGTDNLPPKTSLTLTEIAQIQRAQIKSTSYAIHTQLHKICCLIDDAIAALKATRETEVEAENLNYANVSRTTRLLERLYPFLRLVDLMIFESLSSHLINFLTGLYDQVCGRESESPHNQDHPVMEESSIQRRHSGTHEAADVHLTVMFRLRRRVAPTPFISVKLIEEIDPATIPSAPVRVDVSPTKEEALATVYSFLNGYVSVLDETAHLLSDSRFTNILAPYTPQNRESFLDRLYKPSAQLLQQNAPALREMRHAIDTYYKQLEIQVSERVSLVGKVFAALQRERDLQELSKISSDVGSGHLLTAEQHEEIHSTWANLHARIGATPGILQIGILLFDQSSLLKKLQDFVSVRMHSMMDDLPSIYSQFLSDMLANVDGRIDRIMKIPTSVSEAITWLKDLMEMMPSHSFRQQFDLKCANLVNLKRMVKANQAVADATVDRDALKKKDHEWESTYETLMICFARVQEKESEHRRSVAELSAKADDYVSAQVSLVKADFSKLPTHEQELKLDKRLASELEKRKKDILARLERLVALEGERQEMMERYAEFAREHRLLDDPESQDELGPIKTATPSDSSLPCEMLLQHVSIVVDMRAWYGTWVGVESKWLDTPLPSVHASLVLSRIKQYRRRLQYASTRLLPPSAGEDESYTQRDHCLVVDLQDRVEQMANDYIIFQAATSGAFGEYRWRASNKMLGLSDVEPSRTTLRMIKEASVTKSEAIEDFTRTCHQVLIEAKLRSQAERLRHRLSLCSLHAVTATYSVTIMNLQTTIFDLDDLLMSTKLLMQPQNKNLHDVSSLQREIEAKLSLCDYILTFQKRWAQIAQLARVSDVDEFFTGQVAWKGPVQRQKKKTGRDETIWQQFADTSQEWSERLRRLVCMCQASMDPTKTITQVSEPTGTPTVPCSLDDALQAFNSFDFDIAVQKCEHASQLILRYVSSVRDSCPRLHNVSARDTIDLLVQEDSITSLRGTLKLCHPHVPSFWIERSRKQGESSSGDIGVGAITIKGWESHGCRHDFAAPVVKVGRIKFWLSRLEEEMAGIIHENLKHAVGGVLALTGPDGLCDNLAGILPQSVSTALIVRFSSVVHCAFQRCQNIPSRDVTRADVASIFDQLRDFPRKAVQRCIADRATQLWSPRDDILFDSAIILLQFQAQVVDMMTAASKSDGSEGAQAIWRSQLKVSIVVEDPTTKAIRQVQGCSKSEWEDTVALSPSFPITFIARIGECEFTLGREYIGCHRVPVITPLTERCTFAIMRASHSSALAIVTPVTHGRDNLRWCIRGIAQTLMKPLNEVSFDEARGLDMTHVADMLQSVLCFGSILALYHVQKLDTQRFRAVVERLKQLRQEVDCGVVQVQQPHCTLESRALPMLRPVAAVFLPISEAGMIHEAPLWRLSSMAKYFQPIAIVMPNLTYFIQTMLLLAGYQPDELNKLHAVVNFFHLFAEKISKPDASAVYRFISKVTMRVKELRGSSRVLLPSTSKTPLQTRANADSRSTRRLANYFRRSQDAQDTTDAVVHTLFSHAIGVSYRAVVARVGFSHGDIDELIHQGFPSSRGCDIQEKSMKSRDDAIWAALEMSLAHSGYSQNPELQEKAMELAAILSTNKSVILLGSPASGKSTCLKTLHKALEALSMAEDEDARGGESNLAPRQNGQAKLMHVSSRFVSSLLRVEDNRNSADAWRQFWLCIDGRIIESPEAALFLEGKFQSAASPQSESARLLFETNDLSTASPSFVIQRRVLYFPRLVTQDHLLASWRASWEPKLPFPDDSKGADNVALVFRLMQRLIKGVVHQFINAEERSTRSALVAEGALLDKEVASRSKDATHFGMLSVLQLTQTSLRLVGSLCFLHRAHLEELAPSQVARMVVFSVLWGFSAHLSEYNRRKLEQAVRAEVATMTEFNRGSADLSGDLLDSERVGNGHAFWSKLDLPLRSASVENSTESQAMTRYIFDSRNGNVLVMTPVITGLVRIARLLIQSTHSFLIAGPRGSGKSSLLRLLWLMNEDDREAEARIDASLDHRFAPAILNWCRKPHTWFSAPSASQYLADSQIRSRAADEASFFAPFSRVDASRMVFVDDLAMTEDPSNLDEFVRSVIDHQSAVRWSDSRATTVTKAFGGAMTRQKPMATKSRLDKATERLLRHFAVLQLPATDRSQMQGLFRLAHRGFFESSSMKATRTKRSDSSLSLQEIVLRASVDLAFDTLTVQQTSETSELVDGFTFNLHHLDAILRRTLGFAQQLASRNIGSAEDNSATLLTLGKLQQGWSTAIRDVYLLACARLAPEPREEGSNDITAVLAVDEFKKVTQSMKAISEKYFSAAMREDPAASMRADIVLNVYQYVTSRSSLIAVDRARLEELLTSSTSGSSGTGAKRTPGTVDGGATAPSVIKDERAAQAARELLLETVVNGLSEDAEAMCQASAIDRLSLRLHFSTTFGCHQLAQALQALSSGSNLFVDCSISATQRRVLWSAFAAEGFDVIDTEELSTSGGRLRDAWHDSLIHALPHGRRVLLWIDLHSLKTESVEFLEASVSALCLDKFPPAFFESLRLRDEVIRGCAQSQQTLTVLSDEDVSGFLRRWLLKNFRLCILVDQGTSLYQSFDGFARLIRNSGAFQWISFASLQPQDAKTYQRQVLEQAVRELHKQIDLPSAESDVDVDGSRYRLLESECRAAFPSDPMDHDDLLSFVADTVTELVRRAEEARKQLTCCQNLVHRLEDIGKRVPWLEHQMVALTTQQERLLLWLRELQEPTEALGQQLQECKQLLADREDEMASDEARALHRRIEMYEHKIWAHRAMMNEYDLAGSEATHRYEEMNDELQHWKRHQPTRDVAYRRQQLELASLACAVQDPCRLLGESLKMARDIESITGDSEARVHLDPSARLVEELWLSRFPFIAADAPESIALRVLNAIDSIHSRIPIVVDPTGLMQRILVHVFSGLPWYTDGNDDRGRRENHMTTGVPGSISGIIVQCDGSEKMWSKLREAVEKELPALLVNIAEDQLPFITAFFRRHSKGESRYKALSELTHAAYALQLKKDEGYKQTVLSDRKQPTESKPLKTSPQLLPGATAAVSIPGAGAVRRGSVAGESTSSPRRDSLVLAAGMSLPAPKGPGILLIAVTDNVFQRRVSHPFKSLRMAWLHREVDAFFRESHTRRCNKKLARDLADARRVASDWAHKSLVASNALWPVVVDCTCLSVEYRDSFMLRLTQQITTHDNHLKHQDQVAHLLGSLAVQQQELTQISQAVTRVVTCAVDLSSIMSSTTGTSSVVSRSCQFYEQIADQAAARLMKTMDTEGSTAVVSGNEIVGHTLVSVLDALVSSAHRSILFMLLRVAKSVDSSESVPAQIETVKLWLLHGGYPVSRSHPKAETHKITATEVDAPATALAPSLSTKPIGGSSSNSLVERLRRKVRVCTLLFDQVGRTQEPTSDSVRNVGGRSKKQQTPKTKDSLTHAKASAVGLSEELLKCFRRAARSAKALWCEWKVAREDERAEVRHILAALYGNSLRPLAVAGKRKDGPAGAQPSCVYILSLRDVASSTLTVSASSDGTLLEPDSPIEDRLAVVVFAKLFFPHLLHALWAQAFPRDDPPLGDTSSPRSTAELLGIDGRESDVPASLPALIDVAWRRNDLVHRPTRVLLYDATTDQDTVELILLSAASLKSQPLRVFSTIDSEQYEARLRSQLTASITSKERFVVELSSPTDFDWLLAIVSQIINQHALLCVPEWYIACDTSTFATVSSHAKQVLHVHAISQHREPIDNQSRLATWLAESVGFSEADASAIAQGLLHRGDDSESMRKSLTQSVNELATQYKTIQAHPDKRERGRLLKVLVHERTQGTHTTGKAPSDTIQDAIASMSFLGELLRLPATTPAASPAVMQLKDTHAAFASELEALITLLTQESGRSQVFPVWWSGVISQEVEATSRLATALCEALTRQDQDASRAALLASGLVPIEWMLTHMPSLSDQCFSNVVSVAQIVVLVLSRVGFIVQALLQADPLPALQLSLFENPINFLRSLVENYAASIGIDSSSVQLTLEPATPAMDDASTASAASKSSKSSNRRASIQPTKAIEVSRAVVADNSTTEPQGPACLIVSESRAISGVVVEGLVIAERVQHQVILHLLPPCRMSCGIEPATSDQATRTCEVRVSTLLSTSPFQSMPTSYWSEPDPPPALRVRLSTTLLVSRPSLARALTDDSCVNTMVLCVPVFSADDDDADA